MSVWNAFWIGIYCRADTCPIYGRIMEFKIRTPHRARQKELDVRLLLSIQTFKCKESYPNLFAQDRVFVQN